MKGFLTFVREQGVIGLAVGFLLGGSVSKVVTALITDIVNPLLGIILGNTGDLKTSYFMLGTAKILWGDFVGTLLDFLIIGAIVYIFVKGLKIDRLDKKKG